MSEIIVSERQYTLCFCIRGDLVLMLLRNKNPHQGLWNGLGGKLEAGEIALEGLFREVSEEAEIDLRTLQNTIMAVFLNTTIAAQMLSFIPIS